VPSFGGVPVGEVGGLAGIRIVSETLAIDLRPVDVDDALRAGDTVSASLGSVRMIQYGAAAYVTATYRLANTGPARTVDLHFAHGADDVSDFRVDVDGRLVAGAPGDAPVPEDWLTPSHTPGPSGSQSFLYDGGFRDDSAAPRLWSFRAPLPAGPSRLTVRYRADAGTYVAQPLIVRQFAYILAPARTWAGFGTLDVTVDVPPGWQAWSDPPLERRGDTLVGRFDGVPADALALSVQPTESAARIAARWSSRVVLLLVFVAGGPLCWHIGRRRRRRWPRRLAIGVLCALAWAAAIGLAGWLAVAAPDAVTPAAHVTHYGYGLIMAVIGVAGLAAFAAPLGLAITWFAGRAAPLPTPDLPTPVLTTLEADPIPPVPGTAQTSQPPATPPR